MDHVLIAIIAICTATISLVAAGHALLNLRAQVARRSQVVRAHAFEKLPSLRHQRLKCFVVSDVAEVKVRQELDRTQSSVSRGRKGL